MVGAARRSPGTSTSAVSVPRPDVSGTRSPSATCCRRSATPVSANIGTLSIRQSGQPSLSQPEALDSRLLIAFIYPDDAGGHHAVLNLMTSSSLHPFLSAMILQSRTIAEKPVDWFS